MNSVKSRYALCDVDSSHFQELKFSGKTNMSTSPNQPGFVWVPYIMMQPSVTILSDGSWSDADRKYWRRLAEVEKRTQKIEKIRNRMK